MGEHGVVTPHPARSARHPLPKGEGCFRMTSIRKRHRNYERLLVPNSAASPLLQDLAEHAEHLIVNQTVRCEDIVTEQIERFKTVKSAR